MSIWTGKEYYNVRKECKGTVGHRGKTRNVRKDKAVFCTKNTVKRNTVKS